MREALEFYANQENWIPHTRALPIGNGTITQSNIEIMGASKAKQALSDAPTIKTRYGEWLLIESAPKEKDILVYCEKTGECFVVFWGIQVGTGKGGWVISRANDGTCFICKNPTHWMPLPDTPKEGE
jgi:hypothetical protein